MGFKLLVCGNQQRDANQVHETLTRIHKHRPVAQLVTGDGGFADATAKKWARLAGVPVITFRADYERHGADAATIRNVLMLEEGQPDGVAAFRGDAQTRHMVDIAQAHDVPVMKIPTR